MPQTVYSRRHRFAFGSPTAFAEAAAIAPEAGARFGAATTASVAAGGDSAGRIVAAIADRVERWPASVAAKVGSDTRLWSRYRAGAGASAGPGAGLD